MDVYLGVRYFVFCDETIIPFKCLLKACVVIPWHFLSPYGSAAF